MVLEQIRIGETFGSLSPWDISPDFVTIGRYQRLSLPAQKFATPSPAPRCNKTDTQSRATCLASVNTVAYKNANNVRYRLESAVGRRNATMAFAARSTEGCHVGYRIAGRRRNR